MTLRWFEKSLERLQKSPVADLRMTQRWFVANFSIFWLISIVFFDIVYMDLLCFVNIVKNYNHSAKLAHVYKDVMTIFILINLEVVRKFTKIRLTTFTC